MSEQDADIEDNAAEEAEEELSEWEQSVASSLAAADMPMWDHKARAAIFAQGHRGLLDLELDFPSEYLKGPAPLCYVWKIAVEDGMRVHAYADIEGGCYHLLWDDEDESVPQNQPVHRVSACGTEGCQACAAAQLLVASLGTRLH